MGAYPIKMKLTFFVRVAFKETTAFVVKENRNYISDKKQFTYILTQNGIPILVHFKFFRV